MDIGQPATLPSTVMFSCDGDFTIRQGDWLRLCDSLGISIAHDVWVGLGGVVYENSGPGGCVRTNTLANVLAGRRFIIIIGRTHPDDLSTRTDFAESRLGTPWTAFYTCQDFASEVATGKAESFQREGVLIASAVIAGVFLLANQLPDSGSRRRYTRR